MATRRLYDSTTLYGPNLHMKKVEKTLMCFNCELVKLVVNAVSMQFCVSIVSPIYHFCDIIQRCNIENI